MTRFWWVRHGPTHEKTFCGWRDVPADLSDAEQIARLDAFLPSGAVLISSDLLRAVQTADCLAGARTRLAHDSNLRELNFGEWEGLHFREISTKDPELSRKYWEEPGDVAPPGGESWNAASARVELAIQALCTVHHGRDIIIVAHFGAILTHLQRAAGCSAYDVLARSIDNLSVTQTQWDGTNWSYGSVNQCP